MFETQRQSHLRPEYVFTAQQTVHPLQQDFLKASFRIFDVFSFVLKGDLIAKQFRAFVGCGIGAWTFSLTGY